jgi:hypothetical protein
MNMSAHRPHRLALSLALLLPASSALADLTHGPDPYAPGYGFDRPHEAAWGGWTRGAVGTLWAEWDSHVDSSHGTASDRTSAPGFRGAGTLEGGIFRDTTGTIGSANVTNPHLSWSAGTFVAGSGNLYSFTQPQSFTVRVTGEVGAAPATRAVLQVETWGNPLEGFPTLNGIAATERLVTYSRADYPSSFGAVLLEQLRFVWDLPQTALPSSADTYTFNFGRSTPHLSLAQVAVDIAPVPVPPALALLGSALAGLGVIGRRKAEVKASR